MSYVKDDIDDYLDRLTGEQEKILIAHSNEFGISPNICAWYDDKEDFYQDWIVDNGIFKTEEEADSRYERGLEVGEFLKFDDGQVVRLVY